MVQRRAGYALLFLLIMAATFIVGHGTTADAAKTRYTVPSSINSTGSSDVTASLSNFIAGVPDGATVVFRTRGVYRMDGTLELTDRTGLTLAGHGSTFTTTATDDGNRAQLRINGGSNLTVQNFTIRGSSTIGGTSSAFVDSLQWQHGVDLRGVTGVTIDNVSVTDVYGDCFYVGLGSDWSSGVHITNSTCRRNGRQGVAVVAGSNVTVDHSTFSAISLMTFNVEPNPGNAVDGVAFTNNTVGTGSRQQLLGIVGHGTVDGVTLSRNVLTGKPISVLLDSADDLRIRNVYVTDNTSATPLDRPYMVDGTSVDGLTVTGNTQPLNGGALLSCVDCTNVTTDKAA